MSPELPPTHGVLGSSQVVIQQDTINEKQKTADGAVEHQIDPTLENSQKPSPPSVRPEQDRQEVVQSNSSQPDKTPQTEDLNDDKSQRLSRLAKSLNMVLDKERLTPKLSQKKRMGEFLVEKGFISWDKLAATLEAQKLTPKEPIGNLLVRNGYLREAQLTTALSEFFNIGIIKIEDVDLDPNILRLIPKVVVQKQRVIPVGRPTERDLIVACTTPIAHETLENLSRMTGLRILPRLMEPENFSELQKMAFPESTGAFFKRESAHGPEETTESPIDLVERILLQAIGRRASDVHLEPEETFFRVRMRVDGTLKTILELPPDLAPTVVSRIKVLSDMDISDHRSPQDGAFTFSHKEMETPPINIRVSTLPCSNGEKMVMRLMPPQDSCVGLDDLGMEPKMLETFRQTLLSPHGIILVTGPTGSGKSTTLYSVINMLRSDKINITTVEDPIEQKTTGITQVQVDSANKVSFAGALRSILRQDPDIIMVGEIRDIETARLSLRAALTGHLVFSTLHTNDSPSAFARLLDMGCEHYLLSSSIRAILAQRLIKRICSHCSEAWTPNTEQLNALGLCEGEVKQFYYGRGCFRCHNSGFHGRIPLFELLTVTQQLRDLLACGANQAELSEYMTLNKIRTLRDDALDKLRLGQATPDEVMRIITGW